jgi:hypothetical protein
MLQPSKELSRKALQKACQVDSETSTSPAFASAMTLNGNLVCRGRAVLGAGSQRLPAAPAMSRSQGQSCLDPRVLRALEATLWS